MYSYHAVPHTTMYQKYSTCCTMCNFVRAKMYCTVLIKDCNAKNVSFSGPDGQPTVVMEKKAPT